MGKEIDVRVHDMMPEIGNRECRTKGDAWLDYEVGPRDISQYYSATITSSKANIPTLLSKVTTASSRGQTT
jgi:hypothetical protein